MISFFYLQDYVCSLAASSSPLVGTIKMYKESVAQMPINSILDSVVSGGLLSWLSSESSMPLSSPFLRLFLPADRHTGMTMPVTTSLNVSVFVTHSNKLLQ